MKISDCIKLAMLSIEAGIVDDYSILEGFGINEGILELTDEGFVVYEESRFGHEYLLGEKTVVASSFVIDTFFKNGGDLVTYIINDSEMETDFLKYISYKEIVTSLNSVYSDEKSISFKYISFLNKLKEIKVYDNCFRSEIVRLKKYNNSQMREFLKNNKGFLRKIERLYEVEKLMENYIVMSLIENGITPENINFNDVNLDEYYVTWNDFCGIIEVCNSQEMLLDNQEFNGEVNGKSFVKVPFDLEKSVAPGDPFSV